MAVQIRAPMFIIGAPRSGTSLLYETLAQHPDVTCISKATKKAPSSVLLTRLLMLFRRDRRPTESRAVWSRFSRGRADSTLGREDATPRARRYLHRVVRTHLTLFHKTRFLAKLLGNSFRIEFLDAIFPDALFIHIIRDGRAVAYSILRSMLKEGGVYWGVKPPGWRELADLPLLDAAALQWKRTVEHARQSVQALPDERYIELRYEGFAAQPAETIIGLAAQCGLTWDRSDVEPLVSDVENRNFKWRQDLEPDQIERLHALIGGLLRQLGYEP